MTTTVDSVRAALNKSDVAYTQISIYGSPDDTEVEVYTETNDNADTGYPSVFASWIHTFKTTPHGTAYNKAVKDAGVSRFGIGHVVAVYLNGTMV